MSSRRKIHPRIWQRVIERDGLCCRYCGSVPLGGGVGWGYDSRGRLRVFCWPFHLDHVVPLSVGGTDHEANLVLACEHCNCSKGVAAAPTMRPRHPFKLGPPSDTPAFGTLDGLHGGSYA